jgi:hypothetical protein
MKPNDPTGQVTVERMPPTLESGSATSPPR